jgi:hypothetical protein
MQEKLTDKQAVTTSVALSTASPLAIISKPQKQSGGHDEHGVERGDEHGASLRWAFHRIRGLASPS